jgi:quercetin dioxygenase-like cupin family protein
VSDPDKYTVIFENERVRVLDYHDRPGAETKPHRHPDSVMITLSEFRRRVSSGGDAAEVAMTPGRALWLPAQSHIGHNIGTTDTHVIFVELKESGAQAGVPASGPLGPLG